MPNPVALLSLCIQDTHVLAVSRVPYSASGILFQAAWTPGKSGSYEKAATQRRDWLAANGYAASQLSLNKDFQALCDRVLAKYGATRIPGSETGYRGTVDRETVGLGERYAKAS